MAEERNKNSFQRLMEEEYECRFTLPQMMEVERKLQRKENTYRVAGDMLDLFFPKIIKTVIGMLGGEDRDDNDNDRPAPSNSDRPYNPSGPKGPLMG